MITVKGRTYRSHRLIYSEEVGQIPEGMFVCHRCDNPPCINPEHLFLGSALDNVRDMDAKGRARRLPRPDLLRLNEERVIDIRTRRLSRREFAELYGVKPAQISGVQCRRYWRHVA